MTCILCLCLPWGLRRSFCCCERSWFTSERRWSFARTIREWEFGGDLRFWPDSWESTAAFTEMERLRGQVPAAGPELGPCSF